MCPAKTHISLGIRPVWSESSLSTWRKLWSLATHWVHSEDSDQPGRMHRLIWVFTGCTCHFAGFVMRQLKMLMVIRLCSLLYWASSWENVSSGVSDQVRLKPACSATEASMKFEILVTETIDITLSRQRTTKALIRLRGCAGWSVPLLLLAYDITHVFSWPDSLLCLEGSVLF